MSPDPAHDAQTARNWSREVTIAVGRNLKTYRRMAGISAQALSDITKALGYTVSRGTITNTENGRKESIPAQDLIILATALDIPVGSLLYSPIEPDEPARPTPSTEMSNGEAIARFTFRFGSDLALYTERDPVPHQDKQDTAAWHVWTTWDSAGRLEYYREMLTQEQESLRKLKARLAELEAVGNSEAAMRLRISIQQSQAMVESYESLVSTNTSMLHETLLPDLAARNG